MFNPIVEIKRRIILPRTAKFFSRVERAPVMRTPLSVGLNFKNLELSTDDKVNLAAWYIPSGQSNKLVIFNHFMLANRAGAVPNPDWGSVSVDFCQFTRP